MSTQSFKLVEKFVEILRNGNDDIINLISMYNHDINELLKALEILFSKNDVGFIFLTICYHKYITCQNDRKM